jgi:hypothetical protein
MPLVPSALQAQIQAAFIKAFNSKTATPEAIAASVAADLTIAIDSYIRSAQVNPGQVVAGTAGPFPVVASTTSPGQLS